MKRRLMMFLPLSLCSLVGCTAPVHTEIKLRNGIYESAGTARGNWFTEDGITIQDFYSPYKLDANGNKIPDPNNSKEFLVGPTASLGHIASTDHGLLKTVGPAAMTAAGYVAGQYEQWHGYQPDVTKINNTTSQTGGGSGAVSVQANPSSTGGSIGSGAVTNNNAPSASSNSSPTVTSKVTGGTNTANGTGNGGTGGTGGTVGSGAVTSTNNNTANGTGNGGVANGGNSNSGATSNAGANSDSSAKTSSKNDNSSNSNSGAKVDNDNSNKSKNDNDSQSDSTSSVDPEVHH